MKISIIVIVDTYFDPPFHRCKVQCKALCLFFWGMQGPSLYILKDASILDIHRVFSYSSNQQWLLVFHTYVSWLLSIFLINI
jgi:hypothetical protein